MGAGVQNLKQEGDEKEDSGLIAGPCLDKNPALQSPSGTQSLL